LASSRITTPCEGGDDVSTGWRGRIIASCTTGRGGFIDIVDGDLLSRNTSFGVLYCDGKAGVGGVGLGGVGSPTVIARSAFFFYCIPIVTVGFAWELIFIGDFQCESDVLVGWCGGGLGGFDDW
jgi:hypothetical protein